MPMYQVPGDKFIKPEYTDGGFVDALKRKLPKASFDMLVRIVDEAIEETANTKTSIPWCNTGKLFGYKNKRPSYDIERLWQRIISVVGDGPECKKAVGGLLRWRIALRPEESWLVYIDITNRRDPLTQEIIKVSEYWLDPNYIPKHPTPKKTSLEESILALKNKWLN